MIVWTSGCETAQRAAPVDANKARDALRAALDGWKGGKEIKEFQATGAPVIAQDLDWMTGHTLVDYEVLGEGTNDDANLRIPVRLQLRTPDGKELSKRVSYVVGTSPAVTVAREL